MFFEYDGTAPPSISALEDYPSIRIIRLSGPIDRTTVDALVKFHKWVAKHKGFKLKHILLDFRKVTRMDTSAVAEIIQTVGELKTSQYRLGAINLNDECKDLFRVLKVDQWVAFYKNESAAVDDLSKKPS